MSHDTEKNIEGSGKYIDIRIGLFIMSMDHVSII